MWVVFVSAYKMFYVLTESLNTDMVKAENPEAVVATEPQGKHICTSLLTSIMHSFFLSVTVEAQK